MNVFFIGKSIKKKEFIGSTCGFLFSFLLQLSRDTVDQEVSVYGMFCRFPKEKLAVSSIGQW